VRARFAQILSAIQGSSCYSILKYFITDQFALQELKPPSKLQEDVADWVLKHIRISTDNTEENLPLITPRTLGQQVALYHIGESLDRPQNFGDIWSKRYDTKAFLKKHPDFAGAGDTCTLGPYGPPTTPKGGMLLSTEINVRDGRRNPNEWVLQYKYLAFNEEPETKDLMSLLTTLGTEAHIEHVGDNDNFIDDVINNRLTDLEALPKCKATSSQHGKLVLLLHLAERIRRIRVNSLQKARAIDEDGMLDNLADAINDTLSREELAEKATASFMTMLSHLDTIREHREVFSKSAPLHAQPHGGDMRPGV